MFPSNPDQILLFNNNKNEQYLYKSSTCPFWFLHHFFFLNFLKSKKLKNRELIFKKFLPCQIANAAKKKKLLYIILTRHTVYF